MGVCVTTPEESEHDIEQNSPDGYTDEPLNWGKK